MVASIELVAIGCALFTEGYLSICLSLAIVGPALKGSHSPILGPLRLRLGPLRRQFLAR